jgi:hypothetical protein
MIGIWFSCRERVEPPLYVRYNYLPPVRLLVPGDLASINESLVIVDHCEISVYVPVLF